MVGRHTIIPYPNTTVGTDIFTYIGVVEVGFNVGEYGIHGWSWIYLQVLYIKYYIVGW